MRGEGGRRRRGVHGRLWVTGLVVFLAVFVGALPGCSGGGDTAENVRIDRTWLGGATPYFVFDTSRFVADHRAIIEAYASDTVSRGKAKVYHGMIDGWVASGNAERFWTAVQQSIPLESILLAFEVGTDESDSYQCTAIVSGKGQSYVVQTPFPPASTQVKLRRLTTDELGEIREMVIDSFAVDKISLRSLDSHGGMAFLTVNSAGESAGLACSPSSSPDNPANLNALLEYLNGSVFMLERP